jgi:hypothetical protein
MNFTWPDCVFWSICVISMVTTFYGWPRGLLITHYYCEHSNNTVSVPPAGVTNAKADH